jgi:hypothetical protein
LPLLVDPAIAALSSEAVALAWPEPLERASATLSSAADALAVLELLASAEAMLPSLALEVAALLLDAVEVASLPKGLSLAVAVAVLGPWGPVETLDMQVSPKPSGPSD